MDSEDKALEEAKARLEKFKKNQKYKKKSEAEEPLDLVSGVLDELELARSRKEDNKDDSKSK